MAAADHRTHHRAPFAGRPYFARRGTAPSASGREERQMANLNADVRVIDADTHYTEPPDLWTSRAPAAYKDRVPHIEDVDGVPTWMVDGAELCFARGGGVVDLEGGKIPFLDSQDKGMEWVHRAAWDREARLQL